MISTQKNLNISWIDVESPTTEEVRELMSTYALSPEIAEDIRLQNHSQKCFANDDTIYLVLHFPVFKQSHNHEKGSVQEIDFIVSKNSIITVRYDNIEPLHAFPKIFETNTILNNDASARHAGHLFFQIISKMYASLSDELDHIQDELTEIQNIIFAGEEKRVVRQLSILSRELINFTQVIHSHGELLKIFSDYSLKLFGHNFGSHASTIIKEFDKIAHEGKSRKEFLAELRDTNDSLLTTKQNEIMQTLTILAFFTFPLSLLVGIFTLASDYPEITGASYDFWLILGILGSAFLAMFAYFAHKRWV